MFSKVSATDLPDYNINKIPYESKHVLMVNSIDIHNPLRVLEYNFTP